jgi:hypothetical protein
MAGISLATEIFSPVSIRDAKMGLRVIGGFGDAGKGASKGTDFVVTSKGQAIPIPDGAKGPNPTINPKGKEAGFEYTGGKGGKGMNERVSGVRIMDPSQNQGRRASYMNERRQTVDPATGKTTKKEDPQGHLPLDE